MNTIEPLHSPNPIPLQISDMNTQQRIKVRREESVPRRRWTPVENEQILDHLIATIQSGGSIEKPNASCYYQKAVSKIGLQDCSLSQLKNQVRNLKKKYIQAIEWRSQTGQGVLQDGGEESLKRAILQRCPHFEQLDEVFGNRQSISPPFIHNSCKPAKESDSEDKSANDIENDGSCGDDTELPVSKSLEGQDITSEGKYSQQTGSKRTLSPTPGSSKLTARRKSPVKSGITALAMTAQYRYEIQKEEVELNKEKWTEEKLRQQMLTAIEKEKFEFEKMMAERKMLLEEQKVSNELELEKFRNRARNETENRTS